MAQDGGAYAKDKRQLADRHGVFRIDVDHQLGIDRLHGLSRQGKLATLLMQALMSSIQAGQ